MNYTHHEAVTYLVFMTLMLWFLIYVLFETLPNKLSNGMTIHGKARRIILTEYKYFRGLYQDVQPYGRSDRDIRLTQLYIIVLNGRVTH